jgi:hypothetical protein
MADRYLSKLAHQQPALVGGGDADEGPEGPPKHTDGGLTAQPR